MAVILKIPFDLGILEEDKRGAAEAPEVISKELNADCIDVPINKGNFDETQKSIEKYALKEYKKGNVVIGLGGDHSVSYGLIKAFDKSFKNKGLLYFDAHPDCQDYFSPSTYEDILRCILKDTDIFPKILLVGVREITDAEKKFIEKNKIKITNDLEEIKEFINSVENLYVSVDIDVLDPEVAPGTGEPVKEGLSIDSFNILLDQTIDSGKLKGADLVEVSPRLDKDNKTVDLATKLLKKFLTL